jgi:hypothetical protein
MIVATFCGLVVFGLLTAGVYAAATSREDHH